MGKRWYVVTTYSGFENSVKQDLERRIESYNMSNIIYQVMVPEETIEVVDKKAKVQVADTRRYIDLGDLRGVASKVEKLLGQFEGSGESLDVFIDAVRKAKRSAIRTNIGSCIGALGVLAPAIMLISRKMSPESEYQVKKDVEAKLAKEQGLDISKIQV
jgi:transcription antitermination factor NusG